MNPRISDKQMVEAIQRFHATHRVPPTIRELATSCGLSSSATYSRVRKLERKGVIIRLPNTMRSMRLADDG